MNRMVTYGCLVGGVLMAGFGLCSTGSFRAELSHFFSDSLPSRTDWLIFGGGVLFILGLLNMGKGKGGLFVLLNCPLIFLGLAILAGVVGTSVLGSPGALVAEALFGFFLVLFLFSLLQQES